MIRTGLHALVLGAALLLGGCFGEDTPQEKLTAIEQLQAKNYEMSPPQRESLATHLASGKKALAEGRNKEALAAFNQAYDLLKRAESAAIYNKAD